MDKLIAFVKVSRLSRHLKRGHVFTGLLGIFEADALKYRLLKWWRALPTMHDRNAPCQNRKIYVTCTKKTVAFESLRGHDANRSHCAKLSRHYLLLPSPNTNGQSIGGNYRYLGRQYYVWYKGTPPAPLWGGAGSVVSPRVQE